MSHSIFRRVIAPWQALALPCLLATLLVLIAAPSPALAAAPPVHPYYRITVIDAQTSRGVPCVQLKTTNDDEFWTDSAGVVAFYEPDLMDRDVFFGVETYGYHVASGGTGQMLHTTSGGKGIIRLQRDNIAQRMYRITGSDVYCESIKLGDAVQQTQDDATDPVMGQDTVVAAVFKGKMYWLWGDTGRASYALGNFHTTGATSVVPSSIDADKGFLLTYFRKDGAPRAMVNIDTSNLIWCGNMRVVSDGAGGEILLTDYDIVGNVMNSLESGIARFNETTQIFDKVMVYPSNVPVRTAGVPFPYTTGGTNYYYYTRKWPTVRTLKDFASATDPSTWEAFTCLKAGSTYDKTAGQVERDGSGNLVWGWKKNTSPIDESQMGELADAKIIQKDEKWYSLKDISTTDEVLTASNSVFYNAYRNRWVAILQQSWGKTMLGEVWYLEADTPLGPWIYSTKIATHYSPKGVYTFYNVLWHPEFTKDSGRSIFYEGTYTDTWADPDHKTPQYDYNQMMYKVDLSDPRLFLPVPVYLDNQSSPRVYGTKKDIADAHTDRTIAFLAPDRQRAGTIPIYQYTDVAHGTTVLTSTKPSSGTYGTPFYALAKDAVDTPETEITNTMPLNEFIHPTTGQRLYTTDGSVAGYNKSAQPICRVWPNPIRFNPYALPN